MVAGWSHISNVAASECFRWEKETCLKARSWQQVFAGSFYIDLIYILHMYNSHISDAGAAFSKLNTPSNYFYNVKRLKIENNYVMFESAVT